MPHSPNQYSPPETAFNCGHPFVNENRKPDSAGGVASRCRMCHRIRQNEYYARKKDVNYDASEYAQKTLFPCGHRRSKSNSIATKTRLVRCRECHNSRRRAKKAGLPWVRPIPEQRASIGGLPILGSDLAKKNPLDGLKMNIEQSKASDTLAYAIEDSGLRPQCESDPARWDGYDEDNPPTMEEAAAMCEGCPFANQCDAFAELLQPDGGVWGGKVWLDGKKLHVV